MAADFIDEAFRAILVADAGIIATGASVFVNSISQGTTAPFILVTQVSRIPSETKDGASITDTFRVQVDSWDTSISTARDINDAVKSALDTYSGTEGNVKIINTWLASEQTVRDDTLELNGVSSDYMVIKTD